MRNKELEIMRSIAMSNKEVEKTEGCENCGKLISHDEKADNFGFCNSCEAEGYWIDPAGGIHCGDESDPASMYE